MRSSWVGDGRLLRAAQATPARCWRTVPRHLVIDQGRRQRDRLVDGASARVNEMSTSDYLDAALDAYLLGDTGRALTSAHREVLVQGLHAGRTTREIAERLNIPTGAVRLRALPPALLERGVQQL